MAPSVFDYASMLTGVRSMAGAWVPD